MIRRHRFGMSAAALSISGYTRGGSLPVATLRGEPVNPPSARHRSCGFLRVMVEVWAVSANRCPPLRTGSAQIRAASSLLLSLRTAPAQLRRQRFQQYEGRTSWRCRHRAAGQPQVEQVRAVHSIVRPSIAPPDELQRAAVCTPRLTRKVTIIGPLPVPTWMGSPHTASNPPHFWSTGHDPGLDFQLRLSRDKIRQKLFWTGVVSAIRPRSALSRQSPRSRKERRLLLLHRSSVRIIERDPPNTRRSFRLIRTLKHGRMNGHWMVNGRGAK